MSKSQKAFTFFEGENRDVAVQVHNGGFVAVCAREDSEPRPGEARFQQPQHCRVIVCYNYREFLHKSHFITVSSVLLRSGTED